MNTRALRWIAPDWPAPPAVQAMTTTRAGGVSHMPYASLNLGDGAGDTPSAVTSNRARVRTVLGIEREPCWLRQMHGSSVVSAAHFANPPQADASVGGPGSPPCVVLTADCLPVVLCDSSGTRVGIAHAGWRGLAGGVIARCIDAMRRRSRDLIAWLGPAIGPEAYEVGAEVREAILRTQPGARSAFAPSPSGSDHWLADLYAIAAHQLESLGVDRVYGGGFCTFRDEEQFFSYRRDGTTGRFATFVWIHDAGNPSPHGGAPPDTVARA